MKKVVSLILAAVLILALASCGGEKNRTYDEAEVKTAAERLIKKTELLNKILWGEGIPYIDEAIYASGKYYAADPIYLYNHGFMILDDIIEECEQVFSTSYLVSIRTSVFSSSAGDYGMAGYTRYYQGSENIMVYTDYIPLLTDTVEYDYENINVKGSVGEKVSVEIPVKVTRGDLSQERIITISLVEEDDGWKIDSPTYASYREQ